MNVLVEPNAYLTSRNLNFIPCLTTLDKLAHAKYFSCIDLKNGYFQLEIKEEDKSKTAFTAPGIGFFEYNRMAQGLCNAPASFQRLMERVLYDVNNKICSIYLDDILVWSSTVEEHR